MLNSRSARYKCSDLDLAVTLNCQPIGCYWGLTSTACAVLCTLCVSHVIPVNVAASLLFAYQQPYSKDTKMVAPRMANRDICSSQQCACLSFWGKESTRILEYNSWVKGDKFTLSCLDSASVVWNTFYLYFSSLLCFPLFPRYQMKPVLYIESFHSLYFLSIIVAFQACQIFILAFLQSYLM